MIRSANPAEGLLRPIGEWHVVFSCSLAAFLSYFAYEYLFMSKTLSYVSCGFFAFLAVVYFKDASRLHIYQRNIRRLRHYEIDPAKIPFTPSYVMLGRGFRWLPIHTQRLRDTFKDLNTEYIVDSKSYTFVRNFCVKNEFTPGLSWLVKILNKNSAFNPFRPLPDIGGNPAIHGVEPNETDFLWRREEREGHTGIFGTTGVGKTRAAEVIIASDIRAGAVHLRKGKK
jgi:hypothetical protein